MPPDAELPLLGGAVTVLGERPKVLKPHRVARLGVALVALVLIGVFLVWLTFLAWPALSAGGKLMRLVMVGLVVVLGVTRF